MTSDPAARIAYLEDRLAEALKFLGHDAREGHSATLALLELHRLRRDAESAGALADRVEANARRSLAAIDEFTALARARTRPLRLEQVDLVDLLLEAAADAWPAANRSGVRLQVADEPEAAPLTCDRELIYGALGQMLGECVGRAVRGSELGCAMRGARNGMAIRDRDADGR